MNNLKSAKDDSLSTEDGKCPRIDQWKRDDELSHLYHLQHGIFCLQDCVRNELRLNVVLINDVQGGRAHFFNKIFDEVIAIISFYHQIPANVVMSSVFRSSFPQRQISIWISKFCVGTQGSGSVSQSPSADTERTTNEPKLFSPVLVIEFPWHNFADDCCWCRHVRWPRLPSFLSPRFCTNTFRHVDL